MKGTIRSFTKYGFDSQEAVLKLGKPARGEGYGAEDESLWGVTQIVKVEGGEALGPKTP